MDFVGDADASADAAGSDRESASCVVHGSVPLEV